MLSEADDANFYEELESNINDEDRHKNKSRYTGVGSRQGTASPVKRLNLLDKGKQNNKDQTGPGSKHDKPEHDFSDALRPHEKYQLYIYAIEELFYILKDDSQAMASFA